MSRLLFAAARGARLQAMDGDLRGPWYDTRRRPTSAESSGSEVDLFWRIHPDDEHLQYGPISTALRETAMKNIWLEEKDQFLPYIDWTVIVHGAKAKNMLHRSLFLLLLAEALSYEGL